MAAGLKALPEIEEMGGPETEASDVATPMDEESLTTENTEEEATEPTAEVETEEEAKAEDAEEDTLRADAEAYRALQDTYQKDSVSFIKSLLGQLSKSEKEELGLNAAASDEAEWTDEQIFTPADALVRDHREQIKQLPNFMQQTQQDFREVATYVSNIALQNAIVAAQQEVLAEALKVKLPEVDTSAIMKAVQAGKTYKQAVEEQYLTKAKKTLATRIEKAKVLDSLPTTPKNEGGDDEDAFVERETAKLKSKPGKTPLSAFLPTANKLLQRRATNTRR